MDPKYKRNPFGSYSTNTFEKISGIVSHPLEKLISSKLPQAHDVTREMGLSPPMQQELSLTPLEFCSGAHSLMTCGLSC